MTKQATPKQELKWLDLLNTALTSPGELEKSFSAFHNYSFGNQIAAWAQCKARGMEVGPMKTFNGWKEVGRTVKQGQKAMLLCQPYVKTDKNDPNNTSMFFIWRNRWFVLSQTDGDEFDWAAESPKWDKSKALTELGIKEVPFACANGNVQGYATRNSTIAINPVAGRPIPTLFHELAHIVLGHCKDMEVYDLIDLDKSDMEVEAEAVTLLMLESLGMPGSEFARGYIQNWNKRDEITEKMANRIMKATNTILKAGLPLNMDKGQDAS